MNRITPAGQYISTIAIIASALVVEPGVSVAGARLDYLDAVLDQVRQHVVGEAGRRFPAVHLSNVRQ